MHSRRLWSLLVLLPALSLAQSSNLPRQAPESGDRASDFRQLAQKLAAYGPDPCGGSEGKNEWDSGGAESSLLSEAADVVLPGLNATLATPKSTRDRAVDTLKGMQSASAEINAAWPDENRFHFEVFDFAPALVIEMSIRTHARFFVFGVPQFQDGKPNRLWRRVGAHPQSLADEDVPQESIDIYPLHRGPAGNMRFLAHIGYNGCVGSLGVGYEAYEWDGKSESATEILEQKGAFGLESPKAFPQIGKLRTVGPLITLPYCWFSAIDWWDNPSLCAVDTYDLSRDDVRFRSRTFNRPDLVPIAKAIEYAEKHDYPAVRGYCGSDEVARRFVEKVPGASEADDPKVTRTGSGKEHVVMDDDSRDYFDVEKRAGGWVVIGFRVD